MKPENLLALDGALPTLRYTTKLYFNNIMQGCSLASKTFLSSKLTTKVNLRLFSSAKVAGHLNSKNVLHSKKSCQIQSKSC